MTSDDEDYWAAIYAEDTTTPESTHWSPDGERHHGQPRMAYRLVTQHSGRLMHIHGIGWHVWDGHRWTEDQHGHAKRAVLGVLRGAMAESVGGDKLLRKDATACESAAGVAGVLNIASALEPFAHTVTDLDTDEYLLNLANGTLDLRTLQLRPHDPADRITKLARAAWHPDANGERWQAHLEWVLPDVEVRDFLQRVAGIGLLGRVVQHVLPILTGVGQNGKGTWYKAFGFALGDYAITGEPDLFMHRDGGHPTGEMDLRGARWVVVSENDKERKLAEATMKRLTGGDPIRARRMHRDFVQFEPSHTVVLVTNHLPKVGGDDPAVWRRIRVIPFDVVIPDEAKDPHIDELLQLEADAVLAWAVEGYRQYDERRSLAEPDAVLTKTSDYRISADDIQRFIAERCMTGTHYTVTSGDLYATWTKWAIDEKAEQLSPRAFGMALDKLGYEADRTRNGRFRRGLALYAEEGESSDQDRL